MLWSKNVEGRGDDCKRIVKQKGEKKEYSI
jgi:hypothetical protein